MKYTITFTKYVNQPVMNAAQKMRLKMTKNKVFLRNGMEHKEITKNMEHK